MLAQCGSYVPSDKAQLTVKSRIFTLAGDYSQDPTGARYSSFERELVEMNHILSTWPDNSLILIDELCRNTNYYEGLALCMAICQEMLERIEANPLANVTVVMATHFRELAYLRNFYSCMQCVYLESTCDQVQNKLVHTYQIREGVNKTNHYGISSFFCSIMS